jgi:hypothetical protein
MIEKYQIFMDDIFVYIYNSIEIIENDKQIASEILEKFPTYVCYFKCDSEMVFEFFYQTIRMCRKMREVIKGNRNVGEEIEIENKGV